MSNHGSSNVGCHSLVFRDYRDVLRLEAQLHKLEDILTAARSMFLILLLVILQRDLVGSPMSRAALINKLAKAKEFFRGLTTAEADRHARLAEQRQAYLEDLASQEVSPRKPQEAIDLTKEGDYEGMDSEAGDHSELLGSAEGRRCFPLQELPPLLSRRQSNTSDYSKTIQELFEVSDSCADDRFGLKQLQVEGLFASTDRAGLDRCLILDVDLERDVIPDVFASWEPKDRELAFRFWQDDPLAEAPREPALHISPSSDVETLEPPTQPTTSSNTPMTSAKKLVGVAPALKPVVPLQAEPVCLAKSQSGRKLLDPAMEASLLAWIKQVIANTEEMPSNRAITEKALSFRKSADFKASKGWVDKFLRRNQFFFCELMQARDFRAPPAPSKVVLPKRSLRQLAKERSPMPMARAQLPAQGSLSPGYHSSRRSSSKFSALPTKK